MKICVKLSADTGMVKNAYHLCIKAKGEALKHAQSHYNMKYYSEPIVQLKMDMKIQHTLASI